MILSTRLRAGRASVSAVAVIALGGGYAQAAGLPPPQFGRSVDIGLDSGKVMVRPPHGTAFQLGVSDRNIPVGSVIDARLGQVNVRTAYAPTNSTKGLQDGHFAGGQFTIHQRAGDRGLSELDLHSAGRAVCAAVRRTQTATDPIRVGAGPRASARVLALLRGTAHGAFRTRGRYSAATVRGTQWDTVDRCDGTLTRVHHGAVSVQDFARHRTVTVAAGHTYLARAP